MFGLSILTGLTGMANLAPSRTTLIITMILVSNFTSYYMKDIYSSQ